MIEGKPLRDCDVEFVRHLRQTAASIDDGPDIGSSSRQKQCNQRPVQ